MCVCVSRVESVKWPKDGNLLSKVQHQMWFLRRSFLSYWFFKIWKDKNICANQLKLNLFQWIICMQCIGNHALMDVLLLSKDCCGSAQTFLAARPMVPNIWMGVICEQWRPDFLSIESKWWIGTSDRQSINHLLLLCYLTVTLLPVFYPHGQNIVRVEIIQFYRE